MTVSNWQKEQSKARKRKVGVFKDGQRRGRGSEDMTEMMLFEQKRWGGLLLLRGGGKIRNP